MCFGVSQISPLDCTAVLCIRDTSVDHSQQIINSIALDHDLVFFNQPKNIDWIAIPKENLPEVRHRKWVWRCHPERKK